MAVALAAVIGLNLIFRIGFFSLSRDGQMDKSHAGFPTWIVGSFESYSWTLLGAMILAGVWQIAEKHESLATNRIAWLPVV